MGVTFGLIGAGAMGGIHARAILDAGAELGAVAGGTRAPSLASEYGVPAEPSPEALLDRRDIDAVIIATPHTSHLPLTQAAADAGKHVFIEKPMATELDQCDAMIEACRSRRVRLMVAHITRFMEATKVAYELVRTGAIGDIRMVQAYRLASGDPYVGYQWVRDPREGGAWLDWGSHGCDIVRWFVGSDPMLAFARSTTFDGDVRSLSVMASFAFPGDVMASIWQSYELPGLSLGTRARYVVVGSSGSLDVYPYGQVTLGRESGAEVVYRQPDFDGPNYTMDSTRPYWRNAFRDQVQAFISALDADREPSVSGEDGRAAVEMVLAAEQSAATNQAISLPMR